MKEYIEREAVIEAIKNHKCKSKVVYSIAEVAYCVGQEIGEAIRSVPAANVVEVVRCKDCKHAIIVDDVFPEDEVACSLLSQDVACNNYCMYGEKGEQRHVGKEEDPYEVREKMDKEE